MSWLALPAVLGTIALLVVTRKGAYASPDSAFYVGVARNLIDGNGFDAPPGSAPIAHFPPLFPALLAAVGWFGFDPLDVASVVNPVLLGATALLVAVVVFRTTGSVPVATVASAALVVSLDILTYHGSALSEPLFVVLALACLCALGTHLYTGHLRWLVAAAVLAGGAILTRYVGLSLVITGAVMLLWRSRSSRSATSPSDEAGWTPTSRRPAATAMIFVAIAVAPVAAWLASAGLGDRAMAFHPPGVSFAVGTLRSLSAWVVPGWLGWPARGWVALVALGTILALAAFTARPARPKRAAAESSPDGGGASGKKPFRSGPDATLWRIAAVFSLSYVGMIIATRTFLDASGDVDLRLMLPMHVAVLVLAACAIGALLGGASVTGAKGDNTDITRGSNLSWVALAAMAVVGAHGVHAGQWAVDGISDDGVARRGLTARAWTESEVLAAVSTLPPNVEVYSNAPDAIYLLTKRRAVVLPPTVDYLTGEANPAHALAMQALNAAFEDHRAALAWFDAATWRGEYLPTEQNVLYALGIEPQPTLDDAVGRLYETSAGRSSSRVQPPGK